MEHRDAVILKKVLSEINITQDIVPCALVK